MVGNNKSQVAIEFLLLLGLAIVMTIVILAVISMLTVDKTDEKSYYEVDDLGVSLQQEITLSFELEDGYYRKLDIPMKINGRDFTIFNNITSTYNGYFTLTYKTQELYYAIPPLHGNLIKGVNILIKENNTLYVRPG